MGFFPELGVSANVSIRQLMATDFVASVASVLADTGIDPHHVTLELTESVLVQDADRALSVLWALKRLGVRVAVDDFGTGHSSLSLLKQFPVDTVKIDRDFLTDLERNLASRLIVGAVIGLAHGLGMKVVAEGIETMGQRAKVTELECDFSQGFYFSRPHPAVGIDDLVSTLDTLPRLLGPATMRTTPRHHPDGLSVTGGVRSEEQLTAVGSEGPTPLSRWRRNP